MDASLRKTDVHILLFRIAFVLNGLIDPLRFIHGPIERTPRYGGINGFILKVLQQFQMGIK